MSRSTVAYPKHMTVTDVGKSLYNIWRRVRKNTEENGLFADYPSFFNWAIDQHYETGFRLRRYDETLPYSPENCVFGIADPDPSSIKPDLRRIANDWNKTVNVFRKACGLKLFEVED